MNTFIERALDALRYPADDPQATLVVVLAVVALGLLVAVLLMAIASPRHPAEEPAPGTAEGDDEA